MAGEHGTVASMAGALAQGAQRLGLSGPVTVWLTSEDGARMHQLLGRSITVYRGLGVELTRWFESAGVRFEWPVPRDEMSDEERKSLGL